MDVKKFILKRKSGEFEAAIAIIKEADFSKYNLDLYLHPEERKILAGFEFLKRKRSYLLGRLCAKGALTTLCPQVPPSSIYIESGIFKFPVVQCVLLHNKHVSISHCSGRAICLAYPEVHPMGVDVEVVTNENAASIKKTLTSHDLDTLIKEDLDDAIGYISLWCAREALSKILKTGLMIDFKFLKIASISLGDKTITIEFAHFRQYKCQIIVTDQYVFAFALPRLSNILNLQDFGSFIHHICAQP